jgi:hypothetical protein
VKMTTSGKSTPKLPYSMTPEYGEQRFNDVYALALQRKKLFKEYIVRHQVLERVRGLPYMYCRRRWRGIVTPENPWKT